MHKKVNSDLLLLILLVVQLGLSPFSNRNNHRQWEPEDRSILLGETSAYTQAIFHSPFDSHRYTSLKHPEYDERDEAFTLFSRLHYFNTIRSRREEIITLIADSPSASSDRIGGESTRQNETVPELESSSEQQSSTHVENLQLSPEDMDLIEILWKQDIDLGIRRDAFDSRQSLDLGIEKLKETEQTIVKDTYNDSSNHTLKEADLVPDPFAGLNYTVDSETGEYLIDDLLNSHSPEDFFEDNPNTFESDILEDNVTSNAVTRDSYLPIDGSDGFCDLNEIFTSSQIEQLLPDDFSVDSDYLSQIEDLEKELERFESLENGSEGNELATEMYPSMEDCWSDTTTLLPLLTLGSSHQSAFLPRPLHGYPSFENSTINFPPASQSRPSESFLSMLQSSPLEVPPTDDEYQPISSTVAPTSIGCAVAESMATLTNDTDPIPSNSIINAVYNSEFPDLLYSNHTAAVPHNDMLISDLLLNEDLHLVTLPLETIKEKQKEQVDSSSDSVSLASTQLPPVAEYQEWMDTCTDSSSQQDDKDITRNNPLPQNLQVVSIFSPQQVVGKAYSELAVKRIKHDIDSKNESDSQGYHELSYEDQHNDQYYMLKSCFSDSSEAAACGDFSDKMGFRKFEYDSSKAACGSSDFMHHNHTYHIPFSSSEPRYKPVVRDKSANSSDDDSCNKDEKKAKELKIPISIEDIINLAIDEYNERLSKYELSEAQLTLIRDIRRRGKNKVAAQNCRKRKMDQISHLQQDLSYLDNERMQLKSKQNYLLKQKDLYEDKYSQLYNLILQNTNSIPPDSLRGIPLSRSRLSLVNGTDLMVSEDNQDLGRGARAKRKFKK